MKNSKRRRKTIAHLRYREARRLLNENKDIILQFAMRNKILEDDGSVTVLNDTTDGILFDREGYDKYGK